MKLHIHVKFRVFNRDITSVDENIPLPPEVALALSVGNVKPKVWFDQHGVKLELVQG